MLDKRKFYINGEWVLPSKANDFKVINPSNEEPYVTISLGGNEDTNNAVKVAKKAFQTWKETSKEERINLLENYLKFTKKDLMKWLRHSQWKWELLLTMQNQLKLHLANHI